MSKPIMMVTIFSNHR